MCTSSGACSRSTSTSRTASAPATTSTSITATSSSRGSGKPSRSWCARASRKTSSPTPKKCVSDAPSVHLGGQSVHGLVLREIQPAFDDAVDEPDGVGSEHEDADQHEAQDAADNAPQQAVPKGADLPAEMRFEPGAAGIVPFHVVDNDSHDPGDAEEEARRLQRVGDGNDGFQASFVVFHWAPSTSTRLRRDFSPAVMRTLRLGTLK